MLMDTNGHTILSEDYCSYEIAKLLKEKGFDEFCLTSYNAFLSNHKVEESKASEWGKANQIYRPTQQMAMKWLRRIHNINIDIVSVWNQKRFEYQVFVVTPENAKCCYVDTKLYLGYEEAVELAIKYCLENLI